MSVDKFLKKPKSSESDKIANAEALIAGYCSEHQIPFAHVDHLVSVGELSPIAVLPVK